MSDCARAGLCAHSRSAQSAAAIGPFVSLEPRPKSLPSRTTGSNGAMVMPATLTVSRCGAKARRARAVLFSGTKLGHDVGPARIDLVQPHLGAELAQELGDVIRHGLLARPVGAGIALRIDAGNGDKIAQQVDDVARRRHG